MSIEATLKVAEGDSSRALDVDDFKTAATGAATETNLTALKNANHADLAAVVAAVAAVATDAHFQAFVAANHTDLAALANKLDTLHTDVATTLLGKNEQVRALLDAGGVLQTAFTYFSTDDARSGRLQTITEQRPSDGKTRTITITRSTATGSITGQAAGAWA